MILSDVGLASFNTSKSRLAVDREFMYIGSAGPGRADGRTDGRTDDFERQYNNFHRVLQKMTKHIVFVCRFASRGSASTVFIAQMKEWLRKEAI